MPGAGACHSDDESGRIVLPALKQRRRVHDQDNGKHGAGDIGAERADEFERVRRVNALTRQHPDRMNIARGDREQHQRRNPPWRQRQAKPERQDQEGKRRRIFDAIAMGADRLSERAFRIAFMLMLGVHHRAANAADIEAEEKHQQAHQADRQERIRHEQIPFEIASGLPAFTGPNKPRITDPRRRRSRRERKQLRGAGRETSIALGK